MDYLKRNLDKIKECRRGLYEKLKSKIYKNNYDFNKFNLVKSHDGFGVIEVIYNNERIRLNSIYSPYREAERWVQQFRFYNLNVSVIMFGLANGVFARALLKRLDNNGTALFYEPDLSLFLYSIKNFDMTDIIYDKRIKLYIQNVNGDEFYFGLQKYINAIMIPTQIVCIYPKFERFYQHEVKKFKNDIKEKYRLEFVLEYVLSERYKARIINILKNIHFIKESNYSEEFVGKVPSDVPIIIVSSGPSLDKNVKELKKAEGKSVILAVDTAVNYLIYHGIKFDAIVTIDMMLNAEYIKNIKYSKYPVFSSIGADNEILEYNKGKKIWLMSSEFMSNLYGKYGLKHSEWSMGGSVSTDAFKLAEKLGTKRIILVGQDLAFGDGVTHAGGIVDNDGEYRKEDIAYVEGINGHKVKTRSDWLRFLYWFNGEIAKNRDYIEVIDATEGGAKIEGTHVMKLSEAIDRYCKINFDFGDTIENMSPTFSDRMYISVKNDVMNMIEELVHIKEKSRLGIEFSNEMLQMLERDDINLEKEKFCIMNIKSINQYIESKLVYSIICDYMETKIKNIMSVNCFSGNKVEDEIKSFKLSREAFEAVIDVTDEILPIMENQFKKL